MQIDFEFTANKAVYVPNFIRTRSDSNSEDEYEILELQARQNQVVRKDQHTL